MEKLKSRKFLTAIATILFVILTQVFEIPLDNEAYFTIVGTAIAYILGQSHVDAKKEENKIE